MSYKEHTIDLNDVEQPLVFEVNRTTLKYKDSVLDLRERVRQIVYDWFVRYNPLYFFSALCILFGTYLVSQGLVSVGWLRGQVLLTGVIQVYEILLIAAAAFLFRKLGQNRAATILGLMEVVFLFDPTFRIEVAATLDQVTATPGNVGHILAIIWAVLVGVKLLMLTWAFELKLSKIAFSVPVLAAIGIAWTSQELATAGVSKDIIHLLATWFGVGLITFVFRKRPAIPCMFTFDEWGQTVLRRSIKAAWIIWGGLYFFHLFTWLHLFDIRVTIAHLTSLILLVPLLSKHEQLVWAGGIGTLAAAALDPSTVSLSALAVGTILAWQTWHLPQKRLAIGTVLALYIAAWTLGWQQWPLPEFNLWLSLAAGVVLVGLAWRLRLPIALLPLLAGVYPAIQVAHSMSMLERGIGLLAVGFLALIAGVAINWSQGSHRQGI